jgi:hypothetical protein
MSGAKPPKQYSITEDGQYPCYGIDHLVTSLIQHCRRVRRNDNRDTFSEPLISMKNWLAPCKLSWHTRVTNQHPNWRRANLERIAQADRHGEDAGQTKKKKKQNRC